MRDLKKGDLVWHTFPTEDGPYIVEGSKWYSYGLLQLADGCWHRCGGEDNRSRLRLTCKLEIALKGIKLP